MSGDRRTSQGSPPSHDGVGPPNRRRRRRARRRWECGSPSDDQGAGEGVLLQHHLMNDPAPGPQKPAPYFAAAERKELVDLLILRERFAKAALPSTRPG